jgi:hypothetical protein
VTRKLIDSFSQREAQEIEAAAQRKKRGKSVARSNESDESDNEYESDDYENDVRFFEIIFEHCAKTKKF